MGGERGVELQNPSVPRPAPPRSLMWSLSGVAWASLEAPQRALSCSRSRETEPGPVPTPQPVSRSGPAPAAGWRSPFSPRPPGVSFLGPGHGSPLSGGCCGCCCHVSPQDSGCYVPAAGAEAWLPQCLPPRPKGSLRGDSGPVWPVRPNTLATRRTAVTIPTSRVRRLRQRGRLTCAGSKS